jgi:hypothetical protein
MINKMEEDWIIHGYDSLTAAGVSPENAKKKMDGFYQQANLDTDTFIPATSETIEKKNFEIVIFSDENENLNENGSDDENFFVE